MEAWETALLAPSAEPLYRIPDGGGRGAEGPVRGSPSADRATPAAAVSGATTVVSAMTATTGGMHLDSEKRSDQQPETAVGDACSGKRAQSPLLNARHLAPWTPSGYRDARNQGSYGECRLNRVPSGECQLNRLRQTHPENPDQWWLN